MRFEDRIPEKFKKTGDITTLQLNITEKCNLRCKHCHVMKNSENLEMSKETMEDCLKFLDNHKMKTVDITGGVKLCCNKHLVRFLILLKLFTANYLAKYCCTDIIF